MRRFYIIMIMMIFVVSENSVAQKILSFDMSALTIGDEDTLNSNFSDPNLNISTLYHGPGINSLDSTWLSVPGRQLDPGLFNSYNWTTSNTLDLNDYVEFTITPNSGYQFSISSIELQHERESNGPQNFVLRTSQDGFTNNLGGVFNIPRIRDLPIFSNVEFPLIDVTASLTIRLYGYNANLPTHTWGLGQGTHDSSDHSPNSADHIKVNGFVNQIGAPTIFTSKTSISFFSYFVGSGPSQSKSFNLVGSNLNGDITINGNPNYELSTNNIDFFPSVNISNIAGSVSSTPIYVRLKTGLSVNNYIQNISISDGVVIKNISCDGFVSNYNVVINEILSEGQAGDANGDGNNPIPVPPGYNINQDEFIELVNIGTVPIDLSDFNIYRDLSRRHKFSSIILPVDDAIVIFGGGNLTNFIASNVSLADISTEGFYLLDAGGTITLSDNLNKRVAAYTYGQEAAENQSIARDPDYTGEFVPHRSISTNSVIFSPGRKNSNNDPLPVELSSFSAVVLESGVKLEWRTETEVNNYGFEVERTSNVKGQTSEVWEKIGFVDGNGNSNSPKDYTFNDNNVTASKYVYRLKQIDNDGKYNYSKAIEVDLSIPVKFELSQNYPNPFNPSTTIKFSLPQAGFVKLTVFNLLGEEVKTLLNENREAGIHTVNFNASKFNSGLYLYKLESNNNVQIKKMLLLK